MEARPTPPELGGDVNLLELFATFLKVGMLSFGGGLSGWIYQEIVVRRRWMTAEDFFAGFTIAQILPGANVTNITVYVGNRVHGVTGAAVAVGALLIGPFFIVLAIAETFSWLSRYHGVNDFLEGMAAAAVGLLLVMALQTGRAALGSLSSIASFAAVFVGIGLFGTPLVTTVIVVGTVSIAVTWMRHNIG